MKPIFALILIVLISASCKKKEDLAPEDLEEDYGNYDKWFPGMILRADSIGAFVGRDINFETYYTKLDTIYNERYLDTYLRSLSSEKDSITYRWFANGIEQPISKSIVIWQGEGNRWFYENYVNVDLKDLGSNLKLRAELKDFRSGRLRTKEVDFKIIRSNKSSDIFNVNFGMSKEDVKKLELNRIFGPEPPYGAWHEDSPNMAFLNKSSNITDIFESKNGVTYYEFKEDKLIRVTEGLGYVSFQNTIRASARFKNFLKMLGFKENIITDDYLSFIISPKVYKYTNNGINITATIKEMPYGDNKVEMFTITYEKAP